MASLTVARARLTKQSFTKLNLFVYVGGAMGVYMLHLFKILISLNLFSLVLFNASSSYADVSFKLQNIKEQLEELLQESEEWSTEGYEIVFNLSDVEGGIRVSDRIEILSQEDLLEVAEVVFTLSSEDLLAILNQKETFTSLFMVGKVLVDGDMVKASELIKNFNELFIQVPPPDDTGWCC